MPPGLFQQWTGYESAEPAPDTWLQTAMVCFEVAALRATVLSMLGVKEVRWPKLEDFLPPKDGTNPAKSAKATRKAAEKETQLRAEREQAMLRNSFGT